MAAIRRCLWHWPFSRGRGLLLRLAAPLLRERPLTCRLEPGVLLQGDLREHQFCYYFAYGLSRDPAFALSRTIVRPGDTVLDVGANVGYWLMGVARRAGPGAEIHAFEAFPDNVVRLRAHLELNDITWVRCHPVAVGATLGEASFFRPPNDNLGVGSLACRGEAGDCTVAVTTLDTFCGERRLPRVNFIKIDVEGGERLVFQGAKGLLASREAPILLFEVADSLAGRFGTSCAETKAELEANGYGIFRFDGRLRRVSASEKHPVSEDLFALRPSHLSERAVLRELIE